jgi:hypothetical protein
MAKSRNRLNILINLHFLLYRLPPGRMVWYDLAVGPGSERE